MRIADYQFRKRITNLINSCDPGCTYLLKESVWDPSWGHPIYYRKNCPIVINGTDIRIGTCAVPVIFSCSFRQMWVHLRVPAAMLNKILNYNNLEVATNV